MGLGEKRAIKEAQEGWLPNRQKELDDLCGGHVPYEIDWESFSNDIKGIQWCENNGPAIVAQAFRVIGEDDLGKESLREGVKKVVIKNVADAQQKKLSFSDGVLELQCAFAQSPSGRFVWTEIHNCLMAGL